MEEPNDRYFSLLQTTLEQMDVRMIAIADEDRAARRALQENIAVLQRDIGDLREQLVGLRVRLGVVWGGASVLGSAVAVGVVKLLKLA